ncbi:hypothetical protein [Caloranaerobacter azorensis]|uniref:Uncharacterized protein n=3 Tax=Caloranaerobacter azorensis TaxID=116090 RepID=A0A1M5WHG7_9FIRM|nr:hypothetical protein [Caloranaerobacter azorensis]KGG81344.1 hypothetical protein Y919_00915 [Caloranaerobacter azorensis H53214]QIB26342.1 hypothetical protein G3A45_02850 [Caloranaerobacter azorensis]SHH86905.1 hypothetical protein SAMN02745135_02477 [Caloranaerobacter azorensis DSM 13643]
MRKYMKAEINRHDMILTQMGAKIKIINSYMCYVTFDLDGTEVSYVYNVNKKNKYFLERIEPYPEHAGTFKCEEDVIETIKIDIEQFKNAKKSRVFDLFVDINKEMNKTIRNFEDLYLYYNVPREYANSIKSKIQEIQDIIKTAKENCERVYFKKDPDTL